MLTEKPLVAVTMGDPAGIGSEVIVKGYTDACQFARPVVIGDASVVERAIDICNSDLTVEVVETLDNPSVSTDAISVVDLRLIDSVEHGELREEYGTASLAYVERAIEAAQAGTVDAIATAPINKQATRMAGSEYAGHTGMLADYTDTDSYAMMLVEDALRVSHVSTHVSLREAVDQATTENVLDTIRVTDEALRQLGIDEPTIAVAGLNPHASDGGLLGSEDDEEIRPAIERATDAGIDAVGPESPDAVFKAGAQGAHDCVVAMYHDQGHIPIKMLGLTSESTVSGVNVTIGLPIIRTSVDHGTAFDIAGQGIAAESSLVDAVEMAAELAENGE
ncbi:4-hydroxythreonine-4-phosphate dehydrogenase PdxA [Haloarcula amylovorans]|uniref:4-hydroxythreonine-4-phosphate dehydrogenase PdxA n=1 Tax=Haloarcula amylovorans TaxID=2562280 RepID=UPI001076421E|nr:4-hydroxythreonine-4-phosphate dehydrogenase PdxA [Halomicroarcula amylolytica]